MHQNCSKIQMFPFKQANAVIFPSFLHSCSVSEKSRESFGMNFGVHVGKRDSHSQVWEEKRWKALMLHLRLKITSAPYCVQM